MHLIVGATGTVGGLVAETLLARGEQVRALVRPESPARAAGPHTDPEALRAKGAEIVPGDLTRPETLAGALEGVRRVLRTANTAKRPPDFERVDHQGACDLIDAAERAGVEQFVYLSAHGAGVGSPVPLFDAKGRTERHLQDSGLRHTIVRPVMYMEDWIGHLLGAQLEHGGEIRLVEGGEKPLSFVATADVAELLARVLERPAADDRTLTVSAGWSTHREIVGMIEEVQGRSVPTKRVPPGEEIPGLPPMLAQLWAGVVMGPDIKLDTREETAEAFGVRLRPIESYVREAFARA